MSTPNQDPRTVVKTSTRLWSTEVGLAQADELIPQFDPAYKFSNGTEKVVKQHYLPENPSD